MAQQTIDNFLMATPEDRLRMARDDNNAEALRRYLGQQAYEEYRELAVKLDEHHLGISAAKNLIFVPGVMGSLLQSQTIGGIWWIDVRTRHHINDLKLSPDGREDADPNNQIIPCSTDPSYEPFMKAVLAREDFGHVAFAYDWRKPLASSTGALKDLVLQLYDSNGNQPVHLVAHSMGGLMVRTTLMHHGQEMWPKLGRVVFLGTPHYGSPAIAGYLKNHMWGFELMALLGTYLSRDTYRSLWGALSMLPAPRGVYPATRPNDPNQWKSSNTTDQYEHPCVNFDMYEADNWKLDLSTKQTSELQNILTATAKFHGQMYQAHQALDQELRDRMLMIAGVGYKTLFRLAYEPQFFGLWERTTKVIARVAADPHREGDGRVPLASATLENVPARYVRAVHGELTNIPEVYNSVFQWLNGKSISLPETPKQALSQHLAPETESEAPHLDGTAKKRPFTDDPGYWDLAKPEHEQLMALEANLERNQIPDFTRVRLL